MIKSVAIVFFFFMLGFFLFLSFFSHHALLSASRAELLYLPPPAEGNLGPFFSVLQTIKTRRSPHRPARQHHRSQPGTRAMYKAWRGSCGTASDLRYGRKATTRHVAAKMPAQCVCRLLLFGWMVWEALAKSLPDLPVGKSPYGGDAAQWGDGSGCIFLAFRSRGAFIFRPRKERWYRMMYLCSDSPLKAGLIFVRGLRGPSLMLLCRGPGLKPSCQVRTNNEWNSRVAPGPMIYSPKAWGAEKIGHLRRGSEAAAAKKKHGCLSCWAGEEYYVIMMHYSRWKLFYLHRWSQSALEEQTLPVHIKGFCAFADDSEILKYSDPCSQPPGGKQEHLASVLCLQSPLFLCKK